MHKVVRANRLDVLEGCGRPREQSRVDEGWSVEEERRARAWLSRAKGRARMNRGMTVDRALIDLGDWWVANVLKVGFMREQHANRDMIMQQLDLSREDYEAMLIWWRDALAATSPHSE